MAGKSDFDFFYKVLLNVALSIYNHSLYSLITMSKLVFFLFLTYVDYIFPGGPTGHNILGLQI